MPLRSVTHSLVGPSLIPEREAEPNRKAASCRGHRSPVGESWRFGEQALPSWVGLLFNNRNGKRLVLRQKGPGLGGSETSYNNIFVL